MGPGVVVGGGEAGVVDATVLKVGMRVVVLSLGGVTASVTSSASAKVSPRAAEGRKCCHMKKSMKKCRLFSEAVIFCYRTDFF